MPFLDDLRRRLVRPLPGQRHPEAQHGLLVAQFHALETLQQLGLAPADPLPLQSASDSCQSCSPHLQHRQLHGISTVCTYSTFGAAFCQPVGIVMGHERKSPTLWRGSRGVCESSFQPPGMKRAAVKARPASTPAAAMNFQVCSFKALCRVTLSS